MSYISEIITTATSSSVTVTGKFFISDKADYIIYMTLYDMNGEAIKRGYMSWTDWSLAPGTMTVSIEPDYPLPIATQYRYAVQLSSRDSGVVLDRKEGYVSTRLEHFEWDSPKNKEEEVNITAAEWNRLLDKCAAEVSYVRERVFYTTLCSLGRYNYSRGLWLYS